MIDIEAKEIDEMKSEISGMGGGYETTCRNMLKSGLKWLGKNPNCDPQFKCYKNIYGVISEENKDAKNLSAAVVAGAGGDCTGAMHQAVVQTVMYIRKVGLQDYLEKMNEETEK